MGKISDTFGVITGGERYQDHLVRFQKCYVCSSDAKVTLDDNDVPVISCTKPGCLFWHDPAPALRERVRTLEHVIRVSANRQTEGGYGIEAEYMLALAGMEVNDEC